MHGLQDEAGAPLIPATPAQRDPIDPADPTPTDPTHTDPTHTDAPASGPPTARRRGLFLLLAGITVVTYLLDQLWLWWAVSALTDQPPRDLIGSFLRLDLIRNPGAAFSIWCSG